jgi:hypothetical protein
MDLAVITPSTHGGHKLTLATRHVITCSIFLYMIFEKIVMVEEWDGAARDA